MAASAFAFDEEAKPDSKHALFFPPKVVEVTIAMFGMALLAFYQVSNPFRSAEGTKSGADNQPLDVRAASADPGSWREAKDLGDDLLCLRPILRGHGIGALAQRTASQARVLHRIVPAPRRGNERGQVDGRKKAQLGEIGLGLGAATVDEDDDDEAVLARQPQQIVDQVLQQSRANVRGCRA